MTETIHTPEMHGDAAEVHTFLIADVRGYTRFTLEHGDEAAARLAARFAEIADEVVKRHGGTVTELRGDEALAVFTSSRQALRAASEAQRRFAKESSDSLPLQVGIGLDAGEAVPVKGGYRGAALNLAARLCSLAGPGEVLASDGVIHLARKVDGLEYAERGKMQIKGFADPVTVIEVRALPVAGESGKSGGSDRSPALKGSPTSVTAPSALPIGGFLGALPEGALVARGQELTRLLGDLDAVTDGAGRLVLLAGEPGIGKTRLAQEVTLQARNRGFLVATGRCYEPNQGVPFYPFLETLTTAYVLSPVGVQAAASSRWPHLGRLLPDVIDAPGVQFGESQEDQQRLLRAVTGFLQSVAEAMPIALLLDDLHWADDSSLALLQHLARHLRSSRILLLGTYRDVEVNPDHPLEAALVDLARERLVERIAVRRLPEDGTAEMMAASLGTLDLPPDLVNLIHSRTEGNPFFLEEVVRSLVERGDLYRQNGSWARREIGDMEVPESVRSVIGQRAGRLAEGTQELLLEASVLGQEFSFDDLEALSGREEEEVERGLEEAVATGLIQEMGRDGYAFNHALTQQALYAKLSARRKRRLHLAAGEALEQISERARDRRAAELAWHFLEGDDPERALPYSLLAGDAAEAVFAHPEAARSYTTAAELAQEIEDRPRQAEAREKLGSVLQWAAQYEEAEEELEHAATLYRQADDGEGEARVTVQLGLVHRGAGTLQAGIVRVREALDRLEDRIPAEDVSDLCVMLEWLYFGTGQYAEGLSVAERAVEMARASGDTRALARAEMSRGTELQMIGRRDEGLRSLETALAGLDPTGDLRYLGRASTNTAEGYYQQGELKRSRDMLQQTLTIQERLQSPWGIAFTLSNLGSLSRLMGEWSQAHAYLERGVGMSREVERSGWAAYPIQELGGLCIDEGIWEEASSLLDDSLAMARRSGDLQAIRAVSRWLAELDLRRGQPELARERLEPLLDRGDMEESQVTELLPLLAASYLEEGNLTAAETTVTQALRRATDTGQVVALAPALLVQGRVLAARELWEEADHAFQETARMAADMPYPHLEARALYERGLMLSRRGESGEAPLWEALAIFRRLGAKKDSERTERALAELSTNR